MSAADGDWTCANCKRADRVTLRCRAVNASYYLFCSACAVVVEDYIELPEVRASEGWTSTLAQLIGPPQVELEPEVEECYCYCHDRISRYRCRYCKCVPDHDPALTYILGGK